MHDDDAGFRDRVIRIAGQVFPGMDFVPDPEEPDVLIVGKWRLGLQNLRAKYELGEISDEDFATMVEDHFGSIFANETPSLDDLSLDEIRDQLRLQVMPADYVQAAPVPIVAFPFATGIAVGIVADFPQSYAYVRQVDLERWKISPEELHEIALENLEAISRDIDVHLSKNDAETILAIDSGDGYDAARILIPGLQDFIASHLGETFRFGIPNRDFLICWRLDCSPEFHRQLGGKIAEDHAERPYALSPSVFVRNSEGNFHEQPGVQAP
ncbi:DUF1444 family protein [Luteolibacter arcticus]|uniref:DUF1444 family protein n=1 Tax=Luteolibacter arcticus TaxID=1581411 RepID=A0ABT3GJV8_9BACT|nr:DUF1444 family protein [Luteolibacter arcticus]MCW1923788.1 DUF1444 family protein [Luteolibacter arcticus]